VGPPARTTGGMLVFNALTADHELRVTPSNEKASPINGAFGFSSQRRRDYSVVSATGWSQEETAVC
jgi:hypothetical protein